MPPCFWSENRYFSTMIATGEILMWYTTFVGFKSRTFPFTSVVLYHWAMAHVMLKTNKQLLHYIDVESLFKIIITYIDVERL